MAEGGPTDVAGSGPPKGSPSDSPWAQQIPADQLQGRVANEIGGAGPIVLNDPAFQPPSDALVGTKKEQTRIVYRDLPLVNTITQWTVEQMRGAVRAHMWGIFEGSGQLVDAILGDDRVQATLGSRISGLFGREVRFRPADDSAAAKECLDAWVKCWPNLATAAAMTEMQAYAILEGFEPAQLVWGSYAGVDYAPQMRPWHPRYTYYNWALRRYIALTLDGQMPIMPGNGKWVLHAPYGEYRGWIRGAVRPVAEPWLIRHWAIRDWARFSEKHGVPFVKAIVPASAAEDQRDAYAAALARLATESTIMVSQGNDGVNSYDVEIVECTDTAWEAFPGLRDHCDMAIVLSIKFQNLTTEIRTGGSYAASQVHENVDDNTFQYDNMAWRWTMRQQVARPFAWLNFGDPELAPVTDWDVVPLSVYEHNAKQFQEFGKGIQTLRQGGVKFTDTEELRRFCRDKFGLDGLPDFELVDPTPAAGAGGGGAGGGGFGAVAPRIGRTALTRRAASQPRLTDAELRADSAKADRASARAVKNPSERAHERAAEAHDNAALSHQHAAKEAREDGEHVKAAAYDAAHARHAAKYDDHAAAANEIGMARLSKVSERAYEKSAEADRENTAEAHRAAASAHDKASAEYLKFNDNFGGRDALVEPHIAAHDAKSEEHSAKADEASDDEQPRDEDGKFAPK